MMALRSHTRGGPENLVYEAAPLPAPTASQVRVAVDAASLTFTELSWDETWERNGKSRAPIIPSHEYAGVIAELGADVDGWSVGQRVYGLIPFDVDGAAADFVCVEATDLALAPTSASPIEAAATPLAALTAWQAFVDHGDLKSGQQLLIHGAAGGVGIFAVQLAKHFGANVTATARAADLDFVRHLGADVVIDFETEAFDAGGAQFDLILDMAGGDTLARSIAVTRRGGRVISVNSPPPADLAAEHGVNAMFFIVEPNPAELVGIAGLIDSGELRVIVARTFPVADGRLAFEYGETHGRAPGKTVLVVH